MTISVHQEIEQLAKSRERSKKLIATFKEGFADNWYMAVRESYRSQLDIKYTSKIENESKGDVKKINKLWTQGPRISFAKGNIIYDTPYGYLLWNEALKHIKVACVVINGKPNDVKITKFPNSKVNAYELIDGFVEFELLVPNDNNSKLIKSREIKMSQNEFVEFLINGNLT